MSRLGLIPDIYGQDYEKTFQLLCRGPSHVTRADNAFGSARLNKSRLIRFQFQLAASILLTSVCASGWPYHEIVGEQSVTPLFVAPVYGVAPAVSLLTTDVAKETATVVAGPVTGTTIVEGSSSGPVTILSPGSVAKTPILVSPTASNLFYVVVIRDSQQQTGLQLDSNSDLRRKTRKT